MLVRMLTVLKCALPSRSPQGKGGEKRGHRFTTTQYPQTQRGEPEYGATGDARWEGLVCVTEGVKTV